MNESLWVTFGIFAVSLYGLMRGADLLVEGGGDLARKAHVSELFIGLTIIALGTSLPELVVSVRSAVLGNVSLAYSNVIGSNVTNILLGLGACALITPLHSSKGIKNDVPFYMLLVVIFTAAILFSVDYSKSPLSGYLGYIAGGILIAMFFLYLVRVYKNRNLHMDEVEPHEVEDISIAKTLVLVAIGIALLIVGGDYAVNSAIKIASILGVSESMIGLTIVALGTSLPEGVASLTAAFKGKGDMAVGNIMGSNFMNISLVLGSSSLLNKLTIDQNGLIDLAVHFIAAGLFGVTMLKKESCY